MPPKTPVVAPAPVPTPSGGGRKQRAFIKGFVLGAALVLVVGLATFAYLHFFPTPEEPEMVMPEPVGQHDLKETEEYQLPRLMPPPRPRSE